ncbi:hypothetical protein [Pedobacter flavus]|uniref:Uncharacterized protein n=1 Tax=Pedobacter flavus TaxID=3113906 RepID=A0ABU7GZ42_9SPHI|nr:hypothetical protein [Pedobacter sp. VNH31]MEE1884332.1 hypothetical protein [Pedobacter sp. VNH31]
MGMFSAFIYVFIKQGTPYDGVNVGRKDERKKIEYANDEGIFKLKNNDK